MSIVVKHLHKRGHSRYFDSQAVKHARDIYKQQFGPMSETVTKSLVRNMNIIYVFWIEDETRSTIAATMVSEIMDRHFRIGGLAVKTEHQRKGLASALLREMDAVLPKDSTLELGVDVGKDTTEWYTNWYTRMGFEVVEIKSYEFVMSKELKREADVNL
jgi:GNAT superfamily N-acetyltransferase